MNKTLRVSQVVLRHTVGWEAAETALKSVTDCHSDHSAGLGRLTLAIPMGDAVSDVGAMRALT